MELSAGASWVSKHIVRAQRELRDFIRDLLVECAKAGDVRDDVLDGDW